MEHPEEIYKDIDGKELTDRERFWGEGMNRRRSYDLGHEAGYAKCLADRSDPLAGYSNLTAAIKAGDPIDWEKLDGLVAKCVHSTLGDLLYPLEVDGNGRKVIWKSEGNFWFTTSGGNVWAEALGEAWVGQNGWTLWVEGEIPLRRKTADQLKLGTYFLGKTPEKEAKSLVYVGGWNIRDCKSIYYAPSMLKSDFPATQWEVIEEYGTFQKPEGK